MLATVVAAPWAVAPWAMRQGLATAMLAHLEGLAREAGCTRMWLEATLNAEPFYRAQGFLLSRPLSSSAMLRLATSRVSKSSPGDRPR